MIPLSQPILQGAWLPSREEMPCTFYFLTKCCFVYLVQVAPVNVLSEHLHLIYNFQILIRHLFLSATLLQQHLHVRLFSHLTLSYSAQRQTRKISYGTSRYLPPPPTPPPSHKADPAGQTIQSQHRSHSNEMRNSPFFNATSSSSPPHNTPTSHQRVPPASRQLFNHRKDDPVQFAALARPSSTGAPPPP
jgi:hypothetical protein